MHLRFAIRQLRKNPGFVCTAVLMLAIGIGAATAIFSLVYAVLLAPLPFPQPQRLMSLRVLATPSGAKNGAGVPDEASYPDFFDWRSQNHSFQALASYHTGSSTLNATDAAAAQQIRGATVSSEFFRALGVSPVLGRAFTPQEESPGTRVIIISHQLWQSQFNASPAAIGSTLRLGDKSYTVIGVMDQSFKFPLEDPAPQFWTTLAGDREGKSPSTAQRGWNQLDVIGRLRPGVTLEQARAEMNAIQQGISVRYPDSDTNEHAVAIQPELDELVGDVRPALRVLFAAVAGLLLIACANVAGLLLARGSGRRAELAVRVALGASRRQVVSQLLTESVLLSLIGGAAGLVFAWGILQAVVRLAPQNLPRMENIALNLPVLLFSIGLSLATGVLFGLLPARRSSRIDPAHALRDGNRTATAGRGQHRLHAALVIAETALGLMLLIGAGLLIRSFVHVLGSDPGFNPQRTLTFTLGVPLERYSAEKRIGLYQDLTTRMSALPGVSSVAAVFPLPLNGNDISISFKIEGRPTALADEPDGRLTVAEPGFFHSMGIRILRGRDFTPQDDQRRNGYVVAINEALAKKYFPGENPIGKRLQPGLDDTDLNEDNAKVEPPMREIIAVTANVRRSSLTESPVPEYYLPYGQAHIAPLSFALRVASGNPADSLNGVRAIVNSIDRNIPVYRVRTYGEYLDLAAAQPRFQTLLLSLFAGISLFLAAVGLYSVLSYMVTQRTFEIGLRIAIGAQRSDVLRMILRRGLALALAGVATGLIASAALTTFLAHLLYGVKPLDPLTFIAVSLILLAVSFAASLTPAWRAAQLDPMQTLRDQ